MLALVTGSREAVGGLFSAVNVASIAPYRRGGSGVRSLQSTTLDNAVCGNKLRSLISKTCFSYQSQIGSETWDHQSCQIHSWSHPHYNTSLNLHSATCDQHWLPIKATTVWVKLHEPVLHVILVLCCMGIACVLSDYLHCDLVLGRKPEMLNSGDPVLSIRVHLDLGILYREFEVRQGVSRGDPWVL